jgi:hypothetical protein
MAKKSQTGRSRPMPTQAKGLARKPQAPERAGTATLVRAPGSAAPETPSTANVVAEPKPQREQAPTTAAPKAPTIEKPAPAKAVAPKPAAPKPVPAAAKPLSTPTREQNQRIARARAVQRARQANLISAESYTYVLGDLKLVVGLAVSAFIVLIALTFVLPH